jgi:hypothetical protein
LTLDLGVLVLDQDLLDALLIADDLTKENRSLIQFSFDPDQACG